MTTNVFLYTGVTALVFVAGIFGVWYLLNAPEGTPAMPGRIEGTVNYPSEGIPVEVVCAEPVAGGPETCVETPEGDSEQLIPTWSLVVPAGMYYVSAHVKDPSDLGSDLGDYRAYYSKYVTCGLQYECTDHSKIPIEVTSGKTTSDIMPYDWYAR